MQEGKKHQVLSQRWARKVKNTKMPPKNQPQWTNQLDKWIQVDRRIYVTSRLSDELDTFSVVKRNLHAPTI